MGFLFEFLFISIPSLLQSNTKKTNEQILKIAECPCWW